MGRKGITPIELVVVIVVTTLLLAVLTPGLNRSRQLAVRLLCETNLRGIGSAIATYARGNDGEFPKSGGPDAVWSNLGTLGPEWRTGKPEEDTFFGDPPKATVSSCLYLLVKYRYAPPKQFVCKGDSGAIVFGLGKFRFSAAVNSIYDCWDFGGDSDLYPGACCSYSYNMPFTIEEFRPERGGDIINFCIDETSSEASPVCADRNPYLDENVKVEPPGGNCAAHAWEGQNVLYKDLHASFEDDPRVGIGEDNIYTYADNAAIAMGGSDPEGHEPTDVGRVEAGEHQKGEKDAFLVNEFQMW